MESVPIVVDVLMSVMMMLSILVLENF